MSPFHPLVLPTAANLASEFRLSPKGFHFLAKTSPITQGVAKKHPLLAIHLLQLSLKEAKEITSRTTAQEIDLRYKAFRYQAIYPQT